MTLSSDTSEQVQPPHEMALSNECQAALMGLSKDEAVTKNIQVADDRKANLILVILCLAVFMAGLDLFIVNVALNHIGQDIGQSSLSNLSWVLNGYAIFYAALLVPAGRLADRYGRKAGFLIGMAVFTLSSLGCALSGNLWFLIGFRCLQAAGGAILTPSSLGLLLAAMPPERVSSAVRTWAASTSLAGAVGPVVGGLLVDANWRWIFVINLPIGILAFIAAMIFLPNIKQDDAHNRGLPDQIGGLTLIVGIGALVLGLVKAPDWGWASLTTITCWIIAVLALSFFAFRSARHPRPIVEPVLFKNPVFAWSNIAGLILSISFAAQLLNIILILQDSWHWTALHTGLSIAPGPCMVWIFSLIGQKLGKRFPVGVIIAIGCLCNAAGSIVILTALSATPDYLSILPGWLLIGVGSGLAFPAIIASATADLPQHQAATGSAVVNMSRQIGLVLGTSILVVILGTATGSNLLNAFTHAWWFTAGLAFVCAIVSLGITPRTRPNIVAALD